MKKIIITTITLITILCGALVFSSFTTMRESLNVTNVKSSDNGWRKVGKYRGYPEGSSNPNNYSLFMIWEKEGTCGSYYWVYNDTSNGWDTKNPDEVTYTPTGALRKNSHNQWYAAVNGTIYILKDF